MQFEFTDTDGTDDAAEPVAPGTSTTCDLSDPMTWGYCDGGVATE